MTEDEEVAYCQGSQRAWLTMLRECMKQLGYDSAEGQAVRWAAERTEIVLALREVCGDHGDNDWPDNLHLADVIHKHLQDHLESKG